MADATATIDIEHILSAGQLPALPQSAIRLLQLSKDTNVGPAEFAMPIETDPGLTGQVLKFVNSSYFGFSREISSVKLAITLVGMRTVKNFALWSAVFSLMPNPKCGPFDLKCLWQDSLRRALFARTVAKHFGCKEPEESFAGALLQDMAVPMLAKEFPEEYVKLLGDRENGKYRLSDLERRRFGFTHAEVAGKMARKWNLPENMVKLIEQHTEIDELIVDVANHREETSIALSSLLPATHDECWPESEQFKSCYAQAMPEGSPSPEETLREIDEQFAEFAPVLKIASPKKSLVDIFNESAS